MRAIPDPDSSRSTNAEHAAGAERPEKALAAYALEFDYLCRTLQRLGVGEADIEDLAHEVFLILDRKWQDYDQRRPLRPYLFGIAFRVASRHRRLQAREVPSEIPEIADTERQPDLMLSAAEARTLVLRALERIPLARRAVFVMHDLDEIPMRVIAETLDIPLFTAYSRLRKARQEFERAVTALHEG